MAISGMLWPDCTLWLQSDASAGRFNGALVWRDTGLAVPGHSSGWVRGLKHRFKTLCLSPGPNAEIALGHLGFVDRGTRREWHSMQLDKIEGQIWVTGLA